MSKFDADGKQLQSIVDFGFEGTSEYSPQHGSTSRNATKAPRGMSPGSLHDSLLSPLVANDGSGGYGRCKCKSYLVRRQSVQKLFVRHLSSCPVHQHSMLVFAFSAQVGNWTTFVTVENGSRCMPQISHRASENGIHCRKGSQSHRPNFQSFPVGIRVKHLRVCGRV